MPSEHFVQNVSQFFLSLFFVLFDTLLHYRQNVEQVQVLKRDVVVVESRYHIMYTLAQYSPVHKVVFLTFQPVSMATRVSVL